MFQVETNHAERMIFLRMAGVLSVDEAHACAAAKEAAVDSLGPPYDHMTLVDVRGLRLQPQEIFAIFTNFVATTRHKSRKVAIVGGEGTARMQFRRVAERAPLRDDMRLFTVMAEARDWLVADDAPKSSQPPSQSPLRPILPGHPHNGLPGSHAASA
jgi:hypothetical protein